MSDLREEAEKYIRPGTTVNVDVETTAKLIDLLRQALAKPEWAGLTNKEIIKIANMYHANKLGTVGSAFRAVEAKLKEKNT